MFCNITLQYDRSTSLGIPVLTPTDLQAAKTQRSNQVVGKVRESLKISGKENAKVVFIVFVWLR